MTLVKGMTEILTPVNLLPNSDFSRDGGYVKPYTRNNIPARNTSVYIAEYVHLYPFNCSLNTVTVSITDEGHLRLAGTLTVVSSIPTGQSIALGLRFPNIVRTGVTYTLIGLNKPLAVLF